MSKNIELQEEFEALISELERLKSINEITSENSINAKKAIDKIAELVDSVNAFKLNIEKDYINKKSSIDSFENSLEEKLKTIRDNVDKQIKNFEVLGADFIVESNGTINSLKEKLEKKIHSYTSEVKNLRSKIETDLTEFNDELAEKIEVIPKELIEQANKSNKLITDNQNEVLKQFQLLNTEIETNRSRVKNLTNFIIVSVAVAAISFGFLLYKFI